MHKDGLKSVQGREKTMSMSTSVVGFKPPDEKWKKMKAVWDSCQKAGIDVPDEVDRFFNGEEPDAAGVTVELTYPKMAKGVKKFNRDGSEGYEIQLDQLPEDVKIIRFTNSW